MSEKQFKAQVNYGWGLSFNMTGKAPAVAKRIFDTYADALAYANDVNDSAIEGLKLSVVADSDSTKNGVYFVQQIATPAIEADEENGIEAVEAKNAILVRLKFDNESSDTTAILEASKEYTDSEIKELTEGIVKSNTDAISILNGDNKTLGSVAKAVSDSKSYADSLSVNYDKAGDAAKALTDAKAYIDNKVVNLDATVGSQTVSEGKHVAVEVVEENGKLTAVTVVENDIASASVLAEVKKDVDNFFKDASFSENAKDTLSELQEYINTDAQGSLAMEQAIAANKVGIEAEAAIAREEESKLDYAIKKEVIDRETAINNLTQVVTNEVNRALDAELTLARDINTAFSLLNTIEQTVTTNKEVVESSLNSLDESITIKSGTGTNSSLQVNAPGSEASGTNSFAVGMDAVASGDYSVAMGRACSATGRGSIALGGIVWIIRLTGEPNAVTYQTNIAYVKLAKYIVGLRLVDESDYTIHVATIIATNVVDDTVFITVDKTLSESALSSKPYGLLGCNASGNSSIALAGCIKALGNDSTAEGYYTVAAGNYSHAEGHRSISSGVTSHAEGRETEASADYSHTEGYRTMAEATASHAEGGATLASGDTAHAEGYGTVAAGNYSHAEGIGTIASGRDSHAEGYYTIATGKRSHAEGYAMHNIYLTGSNSTYQIRYGGNILNTFHFIRRCQGASILEITNFTKIATITSVNISDDGYTVTITTDTDLGELSNYKCSALVTIASGEASHTENAALSSGRDSHAGGWSLATNYCSFSHGVDCTADGEVSTSFGTNTYSQNNSEFALGRSNHSHTGETLAEQTLFSVGCGDFEQIDMSKRIEQQLPLPTPEDGTNALEIMLNGDIWLGGYEEGVKLFEGETKELNTYTKEELDIELDSKIESEPVNTSITNIEESLVSSALRKTPLTLTESEKEQARTNIEALKELTLTVKDNGNIVISNIQGLTKEFMPATPSGDPMHYAYETAGAVYNATTDFIVKDTPWKYKVDTIEDKAKWGFDVVDANQVKQMTIGNTTYNYVQTTRQSPEGTTEPRYYLVGKSSNGIWVEDETKVLHLPGHWYLNGLGDITRTEIALCYTQTMPYYTTSILTKAFRRQNGLDEITLKYRTAFRNTRQFSTLSSTAECESMFYCNPYMEVFVITFYIAQTPTQVNGLSNAFYNATNMKYLIGQLTSATGIVTDQSMKVLSIVLKHTANFTKSNYISKPSILYAINNAVPTTPITITLHADRYVQLAEDADIISALEAKNTALEGTGGSISLVSA